MAYPIPPWISQPADTAGQYAAGLQIGVRIGAEQAAQRLAQQQLLRQEAQNAFKQQYETAKLALEIDTVTRQQRAVSNYQRDLGMGVSPDQAIMKWGPEFGVDPTSALRVQAMKAQYAQQNQPFTPSIEGIANPLTGEKVPVLRTGPRSAQMVDKPGLVVRTNPDGTTEVIQGTNINGAMERSTKAELERKINAAETSLSLINEVMPVITPTTVGPVGVGMEIAETAANILKPGSMSTETSGARQKMRITAQHQFSALKADSQINRLEGAAMKEIADITKFNMASDVGKKKYAILRDLTALQIVLRSHEMGRQAPDSALKSMSPGQVNRALIRGDLLPEEVDRWNQFHNFVK